MSTRGASFLIELSSATATKTGAPREARYQLRLDPGIAIPYLAEPRAQLETLTFANVFSNVDDAFYQNAGLTVTWNPYVNTRPAAFLGARGAVAPVRHPKTLSITLPPGHYNIDSMQATMAQMVFADKTRAELPKSGAAVAIPCITATSTLYNDLQLLAHLPAKAPGWDDQMVTFTDVDPKAYSLPVTAQASELYDYVGGYINLDFQNGTASVRRIIGVEPFYKEWIQSNDVDGKPVYIKGYCILHLDEVIGDHTAQVGATMFPVLRPGFKFKRIGSGASPDDSTGVEIADTDFLGYGASVAGVCAPNAAQDSPWTQSLGVDAMIGIASSADPAPHASGLLGAASGNYLRPIAMMPDPRTGLLQTITASPLLKIDPASTVFTQCLGYSAEDMAVLKQSPFTHLSTPSDPGVPPERRAMDASGGGRLLRTTSVAFHCPSLCSSSYNQHGTRAGALMANVPIVVPSNNVQAWQAMYDSSTPCDLHGGTIDTIDFSLTNQDSDCVDLMGSDFLATVRLAWDRPSAPPIGSFGADSESAYGLRDVVYAASQRNS
jgi:hypothetical protein